MKNRGLLVPVVPEPQDNPLPFATVLLGSSGRIRRDRIGFIRCFLFFMTLHKSFFNSIDPDRFVKDEIRPEVMGRRIIIDNSPSRR